MQSKLKKKSSVYSQLEKELNSEIESCLKIPKELIGLRNQTSLFSKKIEDLKTLILEE